MLLSPLFALRFALHLLAEFPRLLFVVGVLACIALFGLEAAWPGQGVEEPVDSGRLSQRLEQAIVWLETNGKKTRLERAGPVFRSNRLPGWNFVGPIPARIKIPKEEGAWAWEASGSDNRADETCIWVHPPKSGKLVVRYPHTGATRLTGFVHLLASAGKDAHARVTLKQGKKTLGVVDARSKPGEVWEFEHELSGKSRLTVEIVAVRQAKNHVCIDGVLQ